MENQYQPLCLHSLDLAAYVSGTTCSYQKATIEQHLCDCDNCFETLITVLNQHLNQTSPRQPDLSFTTGPQAALREHQALNQAPSKGPAAAGRPGRRTEFYANFA